MVDASASAAPPETAAAGGEPQRYRVLLPLPLGGAFDYLAPPDLAIGLGDIVIVPLGQRQTVGVIWGQGQAHDTALPVERLKPIAARLDLPPLSAGMRGFIDWVAAYTLADPGSVLRMALSVSSALEPPRPRWACALAPAAPSLDDGAASDRRLTSARRRVLAELAQSPPRQLPELARSAGVSTGVVKGLIELGWIEEVALAEASTAAAPDPSLAGPTLSAEQAIAAEALVARVEERAFSVSVLDGVTGAGKTEAYFAAVAAALDQGRQVLVLLPEIALSAQWLRRFEQRFGVPPTLWHSDLTQAERRIAWRDVAYGRARVVVGARSALFLPYPALGLIVVDEEHDAAFKQEDGVIYHARDMAVVRARVESFAAVLVSATPSLETLYNVERGRYAYLRLPQRHGGATLPELALVDMRGRSAREGWLSPPLRTALAAALGEGEQSLLFLNRRGYSPLTLCRACGHRMRCPNCSAWLVEHRLASRLMCHHCGYQIRPPAACPSCAAADSLVACGPGVERLAEEVQALFPTARLALMTSDTLSGPRAAAEMVDCMARHEIDILIGTQIVAKGHHFPMLTLVGVVDADLGLGGGDLRAGERTYQLLDQVAGRAGRADRPGRVLIQTYQPDHALMQALARGDRDGFLAAEMEDRRRMGQPPFRRLAALILSGTDEAAVDRTARALSLAEPREPGVSILGPAPAPLAMLRGRHRRRLLLKAERGRDLQAILRAWLGRVQVPGTVRVQVDIDPYTFL